MLHVCPSGAPNVARIRWGERIFHKRGSLNLLSGPQNRVSLPNKVVTSAGLSRLSVAFEIECPIVFLSVARGSSMPEPVSVHDPGAAFSPGSHHFSMSTEDRSGTISVPTLKMATPSTACLQNFGRMSTLP